MNPPIAVILFAFIALLIVATSKANDEIDFAKRKICAYDSNRAVHKTIHAEEVCVCLSFIITLDRISAFLIKKIMILKFLNTLLLPC